MNQELSMSFEEKNTKTSEQQLGEASAPKRTLAEIEARLAELGDPDDPWADEGVAEEHAKLLLEKRGIEDRAQAEQLQEEARATLERGAAEARQDDEARAAVLLEQIKSGTPSTVLESEGTENIPSESEIARLYEKTIEYDSSGKVLALPEGARFSRKLMQEILARNIENIPLVPVRMLREVGFRDFLRQQFQEKFPRVNFEEAYTVILDPNAGLLEREPVWKDQSAEDIRRLGELATENNEENRKNKYVSGGGDYFISTLGEAIRARNEKRGGA